MIKHAFFVRLEATPGMEKEVTQFLQAGLSLAQALGANAPKLLAQAPSIERIDVLGTKLPG
jgi:hypothetical protein